MARTASSNTKSSRTSSKGNTRTSRKSKATTSIPSGENALTSASDAGPLDRQSVPAALTSGGDEATSPVPDPAPAPQPPSSMLGRIRALLASPAGASLPMLCEATGWQSHSVRAVLTGLRKAGARIEKGKGEDGITVYRCISAREARE